MRTFGGAPVEKTPEACREALEALMDEVLKADCSEPVFVDTEAAFKLRRVMDSPRERFFSFLVDFFVGHRRLVLKSKVRGTNCGSLSESIFGMTNRPTYQRPIR